MSFFESVPELPPPPFEGPEYPAWMRQDAMIPGWSAAPVTVHSGTATGTAPVLPLLLCRVWLLDTYGEVAVRTGVVSGCKGADWPAVLP